MENFPPELQKRGPGRPPGPRRRAREILNLKKKAFSPEEIRQIKALILELIDRRDVKTLSQAADKLGISKMLCYRWKNQDRDWAKALLLADELLADELEADLSAPEKCRTVPFVTSMVFRLKALRPRYRDTYKDKAEEDQSTQKLLTELKELGQKTATNKRESVDGAEKPAPDISGATGESRSEQLEFALEHI